MHPKTLYPHSSVARYTNFTCSVPSRCADKSMKLNYNSDLVKQSSLILILVAVTSHSASSQEPHERKLTKNDYEAIYAKVQSETDQGRLIDLHKKSKEAYLKNKDMKSGFTWAVCHNISFRLWEDGYSKSPKEGFDIKEVRKVLLEAIKNEKESGFPLAEYARFVQYHREPGMPPENYVVTGKGIYTDKKGNKIRTETRKVISDEPRDRKVKALVEKALAIEPNNKFALFMLATIEKDPVKAIDLSWKSIDRPGKRLWEFNALAYIKKLAKDDKEILQRVEDWVAKAKAVVGDSVRAKAREF